MMYMLVKHNAFFHALYVIIFLSGFQVVQAQFTCGITPQSPLSGCGRLTFLAVPTDNSPVAIISRRWCMTTCTDSVIFCTNNGLNPNFALILTTPGCYKLTVRMQNANGDTCVSTQNNINVYAKPTGNFTFSPIEGCAPFTVQAQCNAVANCGTINQVIIDAGIGSLLTFNNCPSTPININYGPLSLPTCKNINVRLRNSCGCTDTINYVDAVCIIPKPVAAFSADTTSAYCTNSPLNVTFTANNAGPNMQYNWYVNGVLTQGPSTSTTFNHSFPVNANCYDIKMVVFHPSGCADSLVRNDYICVQGTPVISFTQNITTACVNAGSPATLTLTNSSAFPSSLTWSISGGTQTFANITGPTASYNVTGTGTYTVTATGNAGPGCSANATQQVLVASAKPIINFSVSDSFTCNIPTTVSYTASGCPTCNLAWTFSNGGTPSTSSNSTQNVTYNTFGSKAVSLIATATNGCTATVQKTLLNIGSFNPIIGLDNLEGCSPVCVNFTDNTDYTNIQDAPASVTWQFPGSNVPPGTGNLLNRCFTAVGCYDIRLIVTTQTGCIDTTTLLDRVCVGKSPICTASATPDTMCYEADTVNFTMSCDTFEYVWVDFGDGTKRSYYTNPANPTTINFDYFYQDVGTFDACLVAHRDSCPGDTICLQIVILPPAAKFKYATSCQNPNLIPLDDESIQADTWLWEFCDGTTSTDSTPVFVFQPCDTCGIRLTVTNLATGCVHSKDSVVSSNCDSASMSPLNPVGCIGNAGFVNFTLTNTSSSSTLSQWDVNTSNGISFSGPNTLSTIVQFTSPGNRQVALRNVSSTGCVDTIFTTLTACKIEGSIGPSNACLPDSVQFQNFVSDTICGITNWIWNFGDGSPNNITDWEPKHLYAQGTYSVQLTVFNSNGCVQGFNKILNVGGSVVLNYQFDTLVCSGAQSCAVNNSIVTAPSYLWSSPGATNPTQSVVSPCFSYANDGDYPVYLALTSANTCTVFDTTIIHVGDPVAQGVISTDTIPCPENAPPVWMVSNSINTDSIWRWDFGDGDIFTSASQDTVFHYYPYPGVYPITLCVVTRDGCQDCRVIDTLVVLGPFGTFSFSPSPGICACQDTVTFTVSTYNCSILDLIYGCNSGFVSSAISPVGTINNPTITTFKYPYCDVADSCLPQVRFGDPTGCDIYYEDFYIWVDTPAVAFTFDNYQSCYDGLVCFTDATTYSLQSYQSFTVQRLWDFGDGVTDTSATPCHVYPGPGGYVTKLFIWSNLGCFDSIVTTIVVVPEFPIAGFYPDDSLVCANSSLCFHDTSYIYPLTGPDFWIWNWGDGNIDTTNTPDACHSWTNGGYYTVTMCVYDSVGCPDCDSSVVIRVIDNPIAEAGQDRTVCRGVSTQLTGIGAGSCLWGPPGILSDDSSCTPTVVLQNDQTFTLIVSDQFGCTDTDTVVLSVAEVFADFTVGNNFCLDDSVCVSDASTTLNQLSTLTSWFYGFDVGDTLTGPNPCFIYNVSGTYTISQLVIDNNGCVDSTSKTITVLPSPVANFSLNDTVVCAYQQVCITDLSTSNAPVSSWTWNYGTANSTFTGQVPPCFTYNPPYQNTYNISLIVIDQNSCSDTEAIVLTMNEVPQANFSWSTSCESDSMPLISNSVAGDGTINFCEWTFWLGAVSPTIDNNCNTAYQFPAGNYPVQLVVGDINGCFDTIVQNVQVDSISELTIFPGDTTICLGTSVDYTVEGIYDQIQWTPNVWISDPNSSVVTVNPLGNIAYIVSAVNGVCAAASDTFVISTIQPIPIEVNATPQQIVLGLTSNITSQIPGQIDSIVWTPDETLDCRDCPNPIAQPIATTTYTATIYYSLNGIICTNSAQVTIEVLNNCKEGITYLPNTFTPNGDGLNDIFMIRGLAAVKINYFRIFDRWGKLVYEAVNGAPNEPNWGWDGNDRNGEKLNPAVFVYTYEIECINGDVVTGKGNVTLVR